MTMLDPAPGTEMPADRLLTAGLKDEAIARRVGISPRTLDRRLHSLMQALAARTRFQAGWQAALRFHPALMKESGQPDTE